MIEDYTIPCPIMMNDLDLLVFEIQNSQNQMSLKSINFFSSQERESIIKIDCSKQITTQLDTLHMGVSSHDQKQKVNKLSKNWHRTQSKNALANLRLIIVKFLMKFKLPNSEALKDFIEAKSINTNLYDKLFKDSSITQILAQMFEEGYLIRAYQQTRSSIENKIKHISRIRQLQKKFIQLTEA